MTTDILQDKAKILIRGASLYQTLSGKTVVIKQRQRDLDDAVVETILQDITLLKYVGVNPIVIHGGGPTSTRCSRGIEPQFHEGFALPTRRRWKWCKWC